MQIFDSNFSDRFSRILASCESRSFRVRSDSIAWGIGLNGNWFDHEKFRKERQLREGVAGSSQCWRAVLIRSLRMSAIRIVRDPRSVELSQPAGDVPGGVRQTHESVT